MRDATENKYPKIIAVDFDGTLVENAYPDIGETKTDILEYCKEQKARGANIILWTNREGVELANAVKWCEKNGLALDAVNDNLPRVTEAFHNNSRKIFANEYIDDHMCTKFRFEKKIDSPAAEWAIREVDLACKDIRKRKEENWIYSVNNLKCALRVVLSILDEDLYGSAEMAVVKSLIDRLMAGDCLTPIEDTPDIWEEIGGFSEDDTTKHYQCLRKTSLFKDVDKDGKVTYNDVDRVKCYDISDPKVPYFSGFVNHLIEHMLPIKMPYLPATGEIKVYCEEFLTDYTDKEHQKIGIIDTIGILYVELLSGRRFDLNFFFKDDPTSPNYIHIDREEYEERKRHKITPTEEWHPKEKKDE